jgi:transposase
MQIYGIDLSMEKFDVNFIDQNGNEKNKTVKNGINSISNFLKEVPAGSILCAENTGVYGDLLLFLCNQMGIDIAFIPGYNIKHSLGLMKGKTDKVDAMRIREYGERFFDKIVPARYEEETMRELQELYTLRAQLIRSRKALQVSETGRKHQPMQSISAHTSAQSVIDNLNSEIEHVENDIKKLILTDQQLKDNYELATSIKGIGPVIATDLLIKTGNFKTIDTARKAASYAGVCPFPNSSGKMVKKARVSPFADKKLKSLLYMGAKSAVKHNKEYRLYYQKKKLEGKPHYLIMNNISNKMLRTVYSVVKNEIPYNENYVCLDPRERKINSSKNKVA